MENYSESERWMRDARDCFIRAQRCFNEKDWRGTVQNAQLAIELSAKAMIALFEEPNWTHSPDEQLKGIIESRRKALGSMFSSSFLDGLLYVAEDIEVAAPWHGWSVYGRERDNGTGWIPAVDLCTREAAEDLLSRAKRTVSTTERFLETLEGKEKQNLSSNRE